MPKVIISQLSPAEIEQRGIRKWPVWTKEISRFGHVYDDGPEECLFLEGDVIIETAGGNYQIRPGDFVVFEKGLECTWDVKKPVKKHYNFP
jgi:uncharacterized cupin superfamily protein